MNGNSALLDSNIIIYLSKREVPLSFLDQFEKHFISVITYMEETPEVPLPEHLEQMDTLSGLLESNGVDYARINAGKSWYKTDSGKEIYVKLGKAALSRGTVPLSEISSAIKGLLPIRQSRIYVPTQQRAQAEKLANKCG